MPGTERIDSLYDIPAIRKEQEELLAMLKQLGVVISDASKGDGFRKSAETFGAAKAKAKELEDETQKLSEATTKLNNAQAKLASAQSAAGAETAKLNVQLLEQNKANKEAAREALGLNDAYKKLEQQYNAAQRAAKNIAATEGESSEAFKNSAAEAKKLSDRLKEIDNAVGQNQRNVGNYKESFSVLEKELTAVTAKLDAAKTSVQNLNREQVGFKATQQRSGGSSAGFEGGASASFEGGASASFNSGEDHTIGFKIGIESATKEVKQLEDQQRALQIVVSQNAKGFNSLTQELKVNEKALQTMRAAGLSDTEAFKVLQKQVNETRKEVNDFAKTQKILASDVPALTGLTVAAKGLAGAYAIGAGAAALFGDEEGKIEKEVQKLVAIMTVLNGLQEAHELLEQKDAVATALAAAAQKAYAFVVGESVGALKAFRIALAATGIGLLILTIAYLAENWNKLFKSVDPVVDLLDKSTTITKEAKASLKAYGDTAEKITKGIMDKLKDDVKALNDELHRTPAVTQDAANQLGLLQQRITKLNSENAVLAKTGTLFDEYTASKYSKNAKEVEALGVQMRELNAQLSETARLQALLAREEDRKAYADSFIEAQKAGQAINAKTIADAHTTYETKRKLLAANAVAENIIIQKQYEIDQRAAGDSNAKNIAADTKYHNALLKASLDYETTQRDLDRQFEETNRSAGNSTTERRLQDQAERNKKVVDDETRTADIRIKALLKYQDAQEKILALQEKQELHENEITGANAAKRQDILNKYEAERYKLSKDSGDQLFELQVSIQKREVLTLYDGLRIQEDLYKESYDNLKQIQYRGLTALSKDINNANQNEFINTINTGINTANENLKKLAFTGSDLGKMWAKAFPPEVGENIDEYVKKIQMLSEATRKLIEETQTTINAIIDSGFEKKKNAIQDEQDANAEKYEREVEFVNNSSIAEDKKADKLKVLEAEKQAQDAQYERKKRQVQQEQAKFQKQASIAQIVISTAQAVIAALKIGPPQGFALAAVTAAIGAAQLARAIATPIPKYEKGTASAKGGPSVVSEKGREIVIEPGGKTYMTPATETIMNIPAGSKVIPHDEINQIMYSQMLRNTAATLPKQKADTSVKDAIMWQTGELKKAYGKTQKAINITINDFKNSDYIKKTVRE